MKCWIFLTLVFSEYFGTRTTVITKTANAYILLPSNIARLNTRQRFLSDQESSKKQLLNVRSSRSTGGSAIFQTSKRNSAQEEDENEDIRSGMEEAFASLNQLKSLDDLDGDERMQKSGLEESPLENLRFDTSMGSWNDEEGLASVQDEVKLYKDMYQEMDMDGGDEVYDDIFGELSGSSSSENSNSNNSSSSTVPRKIPLDDADGIGSIQNVQDDMEQLNVVELSQDTDKFMRQALEEALDEAKMQVKSASSSSITSIDESSILNDEELMKEINAVFDRANQKLLDSIADIKKEQDQISKSSAENRSRALEEEEARLREAEVSVARLVDKVKRETMEVEKAVAELKEAQEKLGDDPLMKAADLKKAGIVKQGALVGTLLFSFRSIGELLLIVQGGYTTPGEVESHSAAAAVQALIALVCGGYLIFF